MTTDSLGSCRIARISFSTRSRAPTWQFCRIVVSGGVV